MMTKEARMKRVAMCLVLLAMTMVGTSAQSVQVFQGSELEQFLAKAKITGMKDLPEGVTLPKKATLELEGTKYFGVFKSIDEGPVPSKVLESGIEIQFQDSWRTEIAAYELDKLLGLGMVPTTVERTYGGKQGSMQFFVDSTMTEAGRLDKKLSPPNRVDW